MPSIKGVLSFRMNNGSVFIKIVMSYQDSDSFSLKRDHVSSKMRTEKNLYRQIDFLSLRIQKSQTFLVDIRIYKNSVQERKYEMEKYLLV